MRKFQSSEYLEGVFRLAEDLVLDNRQRHELAGRYHWARVQSGKTQREIGDEIGYTERTIGAYERGEVDQPLRVAQAWAKATGVRVEWLMTGEGDPLPLSEVDRLGRIEELLEALLLEIRGLRESDGSQAAEG